VLFVQVVFCCEPVWAALPCVIFQIETVVANETLRIAAGAVITNVRAHFGLRIDNLRPTRNRQLEENLDERSFVRTARSVSFAVSGTSTHSCA
jgi:hypothetical protein